MYPVVLIRFSYLFFCDLCKKWNLLSTSGTGNDQVTLGPSAALITSAGSTYTNTLLPRRPVIGNDSWHAKPVQRSTVPAERSKGDQTSIDIYGYYDTNFTLTARVSYFEWWYAFRIIDVRRIPNQLSCDCLHPFSPGKVSHWQKCQDLLLLRFRLASVLECLTTINVGKALIVFNYCTRL